MPLSAVETRRGLYLVVVFEAEMWLHLVVRCPATQFRRPLASSRPSPHVFRKKIKRDSDPAGD
jgi:hypothetical protein